MILATFTTLCGCTRQMTLHQKRADRLVKLPLLQIYEANPLNEMPQEVRSHTPVRIFELINFERSSTVSGFHWAEYREVMDQRLMKD